jgi:transketolase
VLERGDDAATGSTLAHARHTARGGYVLAEADGELSVILIATGSEVAIALKAREALQAERRWHSRRLNALRGVV